MAPPIAGESTTRRSTQEAKPTVIAAGAASRTLSPVGSAAHVTSKGMTMTYPNGFQDIPEETEEEITIAYGDAEEKRRWKHSMVKNSLKLRGKFPKQHDIEMWKEQLYQDVETFVGRNDAVTTLWLKKVENPLTTFEHLSYCPPFYASTDKRLAESLSELCQGNFGKRIVAETKKLREEKGKNMTGRQTLFLIYQHISINPGHEKLRSMEEITHVKWTGDKLHQMESTLAHWEVATNKSGAIQDAEVKVAVLTELLQNSAELNAAITEFVVKYKKMREKASTTSRS